MGVIPMIPHDDFLDPKKNKKERTFPITNRKIVLLIGIDKDSGEPILEYFGEEDKLKQGLKEFKKKYNKVKMYGSWPSRFRSVIFKLKDK